MKILSNAPHFLTNPKLFPLKSDDPPGANIDSSQCKFRQQHDEGESEHAVAAVAVAARDPGGHDSPRAAPGLQARSSSCTVGKVLVS